MFDRFVAFLKNTFTYEEESRAETPKVVSTEQAPAEELHVRQAAPVNQPRPSAPSRTFSPKAGIDPGDFFKDSRKKPARSEPRYSVDPQAAAQQQTNNFSALRPRPEDTHYRMIIDKVFYAKGQGVVVRGTVGVGIAKAGASSLIVHAANRTTLKTKVIAIERDGKVVNTAPAGCTVGLLLDGITRNDVHPGDVIGEI